MVYGISTETYVPTVYALLAVKKEYIYCKALHPKVTRVLTVDVEYPLNHILLKLELLTLVLVKDINIELYYVKSYVKEGESVEQFIKYFEYMWFTRYDPSLGNVSCIQTIDITNGTNIFSNGKIDNQRSFYNACRNISALMLEG
ncbi:hypothetical protein HZS_3424 [Henneguya salminicola]|nr:hypothetical protein HZS_3424 [Henneguya salminicola]